jgi:hypothetical protein
VFCRDAFGNQFDQAGHTYIIRHNLDDRITNAQVLEEPRANVDGKQRIEAKIDTAHHHQSSAAADTYSTLRSWAQHAYSMTCAVSSTPLSIVQSHRENLSAPDNPTG